MIWLRYLLIVASISCLLWIGRWLAIEGRNDDPLWLDIAVPVFFVLNIVYLVWSKPFSLPDRRSRPSRLFWPLA